MKGLILAGGTGSRLAPLTNVVSKQLLPVYDKPMIYYALMPLMLAGIRDIAIITTPDDLPLFRTLLGNGSQWGIALTFIQQASPDGLPQAFILAEDFIGDDKVCLILGDNIFYGANLGRSLADSMQFKSGGVIFAQEVNDPERYGVAVFDEQQNVISIEEKPQQPKSPYAITGLYLFDNQVIEIAKSLTPSARGELEITDIMLAYLRQQQLTVNILGRGTAWLDTGTHESLLEAAEFVRIIEKRQGLKIACLEEIALRQGYIDFKQFCEQINLYKNSAYGAYMRKIKKLLQYEKSLCELI